jgi:hypothetical protein
MHEDVGLWETLLYVLIVAAVFLAAYLTITKSGRTVVGKVVDRIRGGGSNSSK